MKAIERILWDAPPRVAFWRDIALAVVCAASLAWVGMKVFAG